jgi:poly-gamma-glutamate system protein
MLKKTFFLNSRIYTRPKKYAYQHRVIIFAGLLSLLFYIGSKVFITNEFVVQHSQTEIKAAEIMGAAISVIRDYCLESGIKIDKKTDPNNTGLIGTELSEITTTLGHLQAKRTTTNANFAALIVNLLNEAGVSTGDTVAFGCSASFPALMIASMAATTAMGIHPVVIISLGSSSYGANNPDFNLLDIYELLISKKVFDVLPAAISLGGEKDIGEDFELNAKQQLIQQIKESKLPFIYEKGLQKSIKKRMAIYKGELADRRISAFINIGGSQSNMGISGLVLKVKPALNQNIKEIPEINERGVIFEMAVLGIPVIHLLYIKGLVLKYNLPWDPIPLPEPGESDLFYSHSTNNMIFWLIAITYFLVLFLLVIFGKNFIRKFA